MKIRKRKRLKGMAISLNMCSICKELKMCPYETYSGEHDGSFPVCKECAEK